MLVRRTLILAIALLLVVSATATAASRTVNWTASGAVIGSAVEGIAASTFDDCGRFMLIQVQAKGSPGPADIFGFNLDCGDRSENSLVATFKDGSLLNFIIDKTVPPRFYPGPEPWSYTLEFSLIVSGGFGRFDNASGNVDGVLHASPVAEGSLLQYEYGTLTGKIDY